MSDALPPLSDPLAPEGARADTVSLRAALDLRLPRKRLLQPNLLIATWNLKKFGTLFEGWLAGPTDNPKRDFRALWAIAEIISRFDVIALQEVTGDLRALRTLMKTLGPQWQFLMADLTQGQAGNGERMAFVFDTSRLRLSGLAAEPVVPPEWLADIGAGALQRQFARTPCAIGFQAGEAPFILVTLHLLYGNAPAERLPELRALARWMADWAKRSPLWAEFACPG